MADTKITNDNSKNAVQKYSDALETLYKKYPIKGNVLDILKEATKEDGSLNVNVLAKLNPIIITSQTFMDGMSKITVPRVMSSIHLNVLNALERVVENLKDMKLIDSDVVVALSAVSQYQNNANLLKGALNNLADMVSQKLSAN